MPGTDHHEKHPSESELTRRIFQCLAEDAVRSGLVDPTGKSEQQLKLELLLCLRDHYLDRIGEFVVNHTSTILNRARRFREGRDFRFACLLYATWVEHWLNGLISAAGQRRKVPADEIVQIIRDTQLRAKLTWLLGLLGLPRITDRHRNAIIRLTDLRNGFVHYKWQGKDDVEMDREDVGFERAATDFEVTVKYLQGYMSRNIFAGSRSRLRNVISRSSDD